MNHIEITDEKLNLEQITSLVTAPSCGAVSVFMGTTRDNFENKHVVKLEYEAYIPMAKKKMVEVCDQIRAQWQVEHIAIVHRLGVVPVTESSIIIAISSPHRKESLMAVSYAIDTLKATVPIWKKEIYDDHSSDWKANKECAWAASNKQS
ncbi:molybdopterin synthase catalytic subunit-like [Haliotis asinina]|uniref:molybdopterin synthase catalytic subunit-like n=1 Tax=Haliotis asinina TaxID=109174 RepID=UPI0035319DD4